VLASVLVCGRALSWKRTSPDISIPCLLFWMAVRSFLSVSQYISDVIIHGQHSFLFQKTVTIIFLTDNVWLIFPACLVNVYAHTALSALWFQNSRMKQRFHHLLLVQYDWEIHRHHGGVALKILRKPKQFSVFYEHLGAFSEPIWHKTCDRLT
jgi:hypothetical protein